MTLVDVRVAIGSYLKEWTANRLDYYILGNIPILRIPHSGHKLLSVVASVVHVLECVVQLVQDVKVVQFNLHGVETAKEHQLPDYVLHCASHRILPLGLVLKSSEEKIGQPQHSPN